MKKFKLLALATALASIFSLSGCILDFFFLPDDPIVEPAEIEVVSAFKLNLLGTAEKQLYPSYSDKSVADPAFIYESSDESVASVSSSGLVTGKKVGNCIITITLQSDKTITKNVAVEVVSEEKDHYKYTIMLYMCASNLEFNSDDTPNEEQWFFTRDIQEILSVSNIPDSVRIIIETGGTTKWLMPEGYLEGKTEISGEKLQRWEVNNQTHKLKHIETLETNCMATESSFTEFLDWGLDSYEADQMGVIISGHGAGIGGCAFDDNFLVPYGEGLYYPAVLQTNEVANASKHALANSDKEKFTWIGYDCCLMQCADIATINADYYEYMVASQELENATGWNHDEYLPYLASNPDISPEQFLPKICDAFINDNHDSHESNDDACHQTLSVLDLSKADALVSSFEQVASSLARSANAYEEAEEAFRDCYNNFGEKMYGLCDFVSLLESFESKYNASAAIDAVNDMVIYKNNCSKYKTVDDIELCGLNAFFPVYLSEDEEYSLQVGREDYDNINSTKFTTWQTICLSGDTFGW